MNRAERERIGRAWHAEKMRDYRARNPAVIDRQVAREKARRAAWIRLAEKYPRVFAALLAEEFERAGIDQVPLGRPPRRP